MSASPTRTALLVADAAARAVEFVGMPEARLNLAQAVIHLALAPKSNSVKASLGRALEAVQNRRLEAVPIHLRDASYRGAKVLGHGKGYRVSSRRRGGLGAPSAPAGRGRGGALLRRGATRRRARAERIAREAPGRRWRRGRG